MNLFYADPDDIIPPEIRIKGQEAKHITRVLRYAVGDSLKVTDGHGTRYRCTISGISKEQVSAKIEDTETEERQKPFVTLCLGIIKKRDRLEFAVEKAVELGADEIILFKGSYSEKGKVREDRIRSTVLAAMKQSLRLFLPDVRVVNSLNQTLESADEKTVIVMADETAGGTTELVLKSDRYLLIIGPEGGFSDIERDILKNLNATSYSLGPKRLRTETAAIVMTDRFKESE
ncbi:MAG: 16S rRNA (uracil(1498)-N(3))-methyltransferase [Balneolaceae bacterium]|nr:16S rRNA (uracil(1498)-N(3))-methyltransferase [Balneolaceae bacterium]